MVRLYIVQAFLGSSLESTLNFDLVDDLSLAIDHLTTGDPSSYARQRKSSTSVIDLHTLKSCVCYYEVSN